jgi:phosphatidylinositol-bisphosphatase/inositol-1,4,5-trisphosphate 5-phosphatase
MAGLTPRENDLKSLLLPSAVHHDLYFIGSQESLKTIAGSMFAPSKEALNQMIQKCLGDNFKMISSVSLQATHLVVFAHMAIIPLITDVSIADYATGFKNMMGNKGAVTIRF